MDKFSVLKQYFGYSEYRSGQEQLIDGILAGKDVLGIMPTGGGKSLCYQIPALLLPGTTLVITPLISLMQDQVAALRESGVPAAFLNSSMTKEQLQFTYGHIRQNKYKLIYVAPERLNDGFLDMMRTLNVSLVSVDEAHCVSQWGQDFRPSYLKISEFVDKLPSQPVLAAFTATATEEVQRDIVRLLRLHNPILLVAGFDRPNLFFDVQQPKDKKSTLLDIIAARCTKSGIIYCSTRAAVEKVCDELRARGLRATRYHAGLTDEERRQNQEDFQFDHSPIMVATNAFGMGIDKSNVGYVIHYNMPKSLEAYYQEAGRAGRDGEAADCILLFSAGDIVTARFLIKNNDNQVLTPEERELIRRQDSKRLEAMIEYCRATSCLRGYILKYFGETHSGSCGRCGNCGNEYIPIDITTEAQMILSCIKRVKDHLGYYGSKTMIVRTLRGSRDQRIFELGLDQLSVYGLLRATPRPLVHRYIEILENSGYIYAWNSILGLNKQATEVLFQGKKVIMSDRVERIREPNMKKKKPMQRNLQMEDQLLAVLKATRLRLAQDANVPAYIVFSNVTLEDMARKAPRTVDAFMEVSGVGEVKAARYGAAFLHAITEFEEERLAF